jgi:hypothetical protein
MMADSLFSEPNISFGPVGKLFALIWSPQTDDMCHLE